MAIWFWVVPACNPSMILVASALMVRSYEFSLNKWSAWSPGLTSLESWQSWAKDPKPLGPVQPCERATAKWVPARLRRRCRNLSRAILEVVSQCLEKESRSKVKTIFASRYGEEETTFSLLSGLAKKQPLSPMGFSLSVHNTAAGLFSIAAQNCQPSTSIAGGKSTFSYGFLEALGVIIRNPQEPVLLIMADALLPEVYVQSSSVLDESENFYVLGLVLGGKSENKNFKFQWFPWISPKNNSLGSSGLSTLPQALEFIHWLLSPQKTDLHFLERQMDWHWQKPPENSSNAN